MTFSLNYNLTYWSSFRSYLSFIIISDIQYDTLGRNLCHLEILNLGKRPKQAQKHPKKASQLIIPACPGPRIPSGNFLVQIGPKEILP